MGDHTDLDVLAQAKDVRAERLRRLRNVALIALAVAYAASQFYITFGVRRSQQTGTPLGHQVVGIAQTVKDCVDPHGKCYQRAQANQKQIVATLNLGALYGAFCVRNNPDATINELKACVRRQYLADPNAAQSSFSPSPAPSSVPRPPESTAPAQHTTPRPSSRPSPQPSPEPSPVQPTPSPTGGLVDLVDNTLKQLGLPPLLPTP